MSGKALSNGTLSLRFMQNAQRAKLQAQVEAEQAKIKDDAEWSVSQDIREAWGIGGSSGTSDEVQHETSYLPFIFRSDVGEGSASDPQDNNGTRFRGRRTFNAKGKEVLVGEATTQADGRIEQKVEEASRDTDDRPRSKYEKRPTSISGFKAHLSTRRDEKKPRTKTAQMLIRDDVSVRPPEFMQQPLPEQTSIPRDTGFVKPAGVDEPVPPPRKAAPEGRKRDRDHESVADQPGSEGKKRKKRKDKVGP